MLFEATKEAQTQFPTVSAFSSLPAFFPESSARRRTAWLVLCAGVIAWIIAYVLDFRPDYYPPGVTIGRLSAIHGIAGFGAALVLAAIVSRAIDPLPQRLGAAFDVCGALFIAGLAAFGFHIQEAEYVTSWQQQRDFWLQLAPLIQDARPNDNILLQIEFRRHGLIPYTQGFSADEVTIYPNLAFSHFFDFTPDPKRPPMFHGYADYIKISEEQRRGYHPIARVDPKRFAACPWRQSTLLASSRRRCSENWR